MRQIALLLILLTAACAHVFVRSSGHYFDETETPGGRLILREDLPLAELRGDPEQIGRAAGAIFKGALEVAREETVLAYPEEFAEAKARVRGLERRIPERYHRELAAIASASGASLSDLELGNLLADSCCTAFVASGAATRSGRLIFGRNMDFMPAHVLGPSTVLTLFFPEGKKAFVSVGWPGVNGVVSGMNEDGLCAAILVNMGADHDEDGVPIAYRVREILEECSTVEEARALYARGKSASGHFVVVADARTGLVLGPSGARSPEADGLLTCSNAAEAFFAEGIQPEKRARALDDLLHAHRGELDVALARRILGATYIAEENAQAMVFEPSTRTVWVSRGTTFRPAAKQGAVAVELAPAFARGIGQARAESCSSESAFGHWQETPYRGVTIAPRLAEAANALAQALEEAAAPVRQRRRIARFAARSLGDTEEERAARSRLEKLAASLEN